MHTLVFLRHGQSTWNRENRFAGWTDVDLTETGVSEAKEAARLLSAEGYGFDICHTSVLKRAIRTLWTVLDEMDLMWLPVHRTWQLNERHYGALQGLDKGETAAKYGEEQVFIWRRSFDTPPPPLDENDPRHPKFDPRYADIPPDRLPLHESLKLTIDRTLPYWFDVMAPQVKAGKRLLVCAHGNSLRGMVKYFDAMSDDDITRFNIPTGVPLVYKLDKDLKATERFYLGDPAEIAAKAKAVADQGKAR